MNGGCLCIPDRVPVLPLPEVVLFPGQILPLHIFEPRYRMLVSDALAGNPFVAVALLKPRYERWYFTLRAPIHRTVGVGRIVASERLEDGKYNILLRGVARAQIVTESPGAIYRRACVHELQTYFKSPANCRQRLRHELCAAVRQHLAHNNVLCEQYLTLLNCDDTLGTAADLISACLPIDAELRQQLLAEAEACKRVRMLLERIHTLGAVARQARRYDLSNEWVLN